MISLRPLNKKEREDLNQLMHELTLDNKFPLILITKESDPYPGAVLRITILIATIISLMLFYFFSFKFEFLFVLLPIIVSLVILPLIRVFNLKKYSLSSGETTREVIEKAYEDYFKHSLDQSEINRQVFIYISTLEKRFEIILGKDVHSEINDSTKEAMAQALIDGFKENEFFNAFNSCLSHLKSKKEAKEIVETDENKEDKKSEIKIKNRIFFD